MLKKNIWLLLLKGIPIGISNVLPGISGGTIAVVLGIYDMLIDAIKRFNLKIILPITIGAILGLLSTAGLINYLLETYPSFMTATIFGLIVASAKVTIVDIKKKNIINFLCFIIGFFIAFVLGKQSIDVAINGSIVSTWKLMFSGIFASLSMLLPGISGATILVMLGMYEYIIDCLLSMNITVILIFGSSAVLGILSFAWVLSYLLKEYRSELMATLTGLILGSALVVIPKSLTLIDLLGIILGISIVFILSRTSIK